MGKILSTTYHDSVQKVTGFTNNLVNNPFYTLNDKKPIICTYYNINKDFSSLDPGSKLYMDNIGDESPIRYNRIYDCIIYGFNRIELQNDITEFGLESDKISGECYILPNKFIPTENDYFEVEHLLDNETKNGLFIVTDVQKDTLQNGSNAYKISYKFEYNSNHDIQSRIIHNFRMIEKQEGTNISTVVRCEDYDIAKIMDEKAVMLKDYFIDLFYNKKVQSFIYNESIELNAYDPFMIEFLIRNKILINGSDPYIHVIHQIEPPKTFSIDYDKTIFRVFEKKQKLKILSCEHATYLRQITTYGTTFAARYEDYYESVYNEDLIPNYNQTVIDESLLVAIKDNKLYEDEDIWKNILVKFFNGSDFTENEINSIENINFSYSKEAFYIIPFLIFCLESTIENVLK